MPALLPFPSQPDGVPWPTKEWEEAEPPPEAIDGGLDAKLDALIGPGTEPAIGHTNAVAIVHRGRIVAERYGEREMGPLAELAGVQPGPLGPDDALYSWSMAKSILHLAVGVARGQGLLDETAPAPVPAWHGGDDPRRAITWDDLLAMRPGLAWVEEYVTTEGAALPDVITMLYGSEAEDMAGYAASFPLVDPPGAPEAYRYSSGTSNIVARALQDVLGLDGEAMTAWVRERIFDPIGAATPTFGLDGRGTWVASSYVDMVARDWLRLGLLALRGGTWDGHEVVAAGWIDHGRTPRSVDELMFHGAHWWARPDRDDGMFMAHGFEGQRLLMVPARDLVVFRQGKTGADHTDLLNDRLLAVVDLFPPT
jgi:CubicO group peptidase (beta-lactamase class C family)